MPPTLAIVVPCYNSERYIRTTIESILTQTIAPDQIILSDDRSPDGSFAILEEYAVLPQVRVTRPPARTSLGGHYRFLLEQATTDYICFLSSDDVLMPDFVATMRALLQDDPSISLISGGAVDTDSKLNPIRIEGTGRPGQPFPAPQGFEYFAGGCLYKISFAVLSRVILATAPPLPLEADLITDWYWALLLGTRGTLKFVSRPMGYYRIHATNAGHNAGDRWRRAAVNMLPIVQAQVDPSLASRLDPTLRQLQSEIERTVQGLSVESPSRSFRDKLKNLVKSLMARRYGRLPAAIRQAERGVAVSLRG